MKKFTIILSFFITLGISNQLYSQSIYLDKDQAGLDVSFSGFTTDAGFNGFSGSVGYSLVGRLNGGLEAGRSFHSATPLVMNDPAGSPAHPFDSSMSLTTLTPYLSYLLARQHQGRNMLSASIHASYTSEIYHGAFFDGELTVRGNYFSVGTTIARSIKTNSSLHLQPQLGVSYTAGSISHNHELYLLRPQFINTWQLNAGLPVLLKQNPGVTWVLHPAFRYGETLSQFSVSLRFMMK